MNRLDGYNLLHSGLLALAQVEANGIRIDVPRLEATKRKLSKRIRVLREDLEASDVWKLWRKKYGLKANLTSKDQLAHILFSELGFTSVAETETGKPSTDESHLQYIDHPFVQSLLRFTKYEKARGTFLKGIERETVDGRLHPIFNLHLARSYRSSSDSPNFQNFPVRDKEISELIRSLFIASDGGVLVENDFKGIEVSVSACYHKDPNFISYITTPGKDMHRDMAAQIYCLEPSEVNKEARYGAKNRFVFPQFYGDYYLSCAKTLWEWIEKAKLQGPGGIPLKQHLKSQGIKKLGACDPEQKPLSGTFEKHVQEVENDFWNNRFMGYGRWRKRWYQQYLDRGYFDLLTGFRISGSLRRNMVVNYPVQGAAFHCLLWSLIQIQDTLTKYRMKAKIVGQIHDSLLGDVPEGELQNYLEIVERVATKDIRKHFKWLIVPLEIEYEICPPGTSWFSKKEFGFKDGRFLHPGDRSKTTTNVEKFLKTL